MRVTTGRTRTPTVDQFVGAFLGIGIGDAIGWPFEGKGRAEILADGNRVGAYREVYRPRRNTRAPAGSYSDDTQQSIVVAESIVAIGHVDSADVAARLHQLWTSGQAIGYGKAFQNAMERLDAGVAWEQAGDADAPWNGAAMRIGPVALVSWRHPERLEADVVASSVVTHREPRAIAAAVAVARAYVYVLTRYPLDVNELVAEVRQAVVHRDADLAERLGRLPELVASPDEVAWQSLYATPGAPIANGEGISVQAAPTTLASLYAFLRSPTDYLQVVDTCLRLGGDVDSFAAIAGGLVGAYCGVEALPAHLIDGLQDHDRIRQLAIELHRVSLAA